MKKFIIFLFLFVLLFSSFSYSQIEQTSSSEIGEVSSSQIVETSTSPRFIINIIVNIIKKISGRASTSNDVSTLSSFIEKNAELFKSEEEVYILFNNIKANPEIMSVLDNNPELFDIIDQNPELFINNILLDNQKLELFINAPSKSEFLFNSGYSKESLFNSAYNPKFINTDVSQKEENYTVQLWKEWGIMK